MEINKEQTRTFLESLYSSGIHKFLEFRAIGNDKRNVDIIWLQSLKNLDDVIQVIRKYQQDGKNIYVGINARNKKQGRAENIKLVNCLWVDLDGDRDTSKTNLNNFSPKPSMIVDSGNGYHAYWLFREPQPVSDEIQEILKALTAFLDGDRVYDYPRIMRLPGSYNLKDPKIPKLCRIIKHNKKLRYVLSDFKFLISEKVKKQPKTELASESAIVLDELPLSMRVKSLIRNGNDDTYHSRSEADIAVIVECIQKAISDEEIEIIFSDPANKIGEKYREEGNHYLRQTIRSAKKMVSAKIEKNRLSKYSAKEARELIIEVLNTETIFYQNQFYQYADGYYKPISFTKMEKHISKVLDEKISKIRLSEQMKLLQVELGIHQISQDENVWCFANGTFLLDQNKLVDHSPEYLLLNKYPFEYDPSAVCPNFMKFLDQILLNKKSLINFIQSILGYCISWKTSEQVMFFFYGEGENGKSTLQEIFREIAGRNHTVEHRLDIFNSSRETHLLFGKKLLLAGEMSEDEVTETERLKNAISGESIASNPKYRNPFTFKSKLKIIVSINHFPLFKDKSVGMKRRVLVIPFDAMIPAHQKNLDLFQGDLVPELPGIFNFALKGLRKMQKGKLVVPKEIKKLSESKSFVRNSVAEFVHQKCEFGRAYTIDLAVFYSMYSKFCKTNRSEPLLKNMVGKKLKSINPNIKRKQRTVNKKNDTPIYVGIRVAK